MNIEINPEIKKQINQPQLFEKINQIIHHLEIGNHDLTIIIEDDDFIKNLNNQYRGINTPTDVLAFSANEMLLDDGVNYLGDIVISYSTAIKQAEEYGHTVLTEILTLCTHGLLHLLGFDHSTISDKKDMFKKQKKLLELVGINCHE